MSCHVYGYVSLLCLKYSGLLMVCLLILHLMSLVVCLKYRALVEIDANMCQFLFGKLNYLGNEMRYTTVSLMYH